MPVCGLRYVTPCDTDAAYALICESKQGQLGLQVFSASYVANLQDPNIHYQLALLDGRVVGLIGLYLQFRLHHANWIGEIQELAVMPQVRRIRVGNQLLAWVEAIAREAGVGMAELSASTQRLGAYRFYQREGYTQSHYRFTKPLQGEP